MRGVVNAYLAEAAFLYWQAADYDDAGMYGYAARCRREARRCRDLGRQIQPSR